MENELLDQGQEQADPDIQTEQVSLTEENFSQPDISEGDNQYLLSDGSLSETEILTLSVSDYSSYVISSIPVGVLSGAIFMIIGLTAWGILKIFKKA